MQLDEYCPASGDAAPPTGSVPTPPPTGSGGGSADNQRLFLRAACVNGLTRLALTGFLRDTLVRHFANPKNIRIPVLRDSPWRPAPGTGILIESIYAWKPLESGKRPALMVRANAMTNYRVGIGDKELGVDKRGDASRYSTFWVGSHTVFALNTEGTPCEMLAHEARMVIEHNYRTTLSVVPNLYKWALTEIGAPQYVQAGAGDYVIPITVAWAYGESWVTELEAPLLTGVGVNILK